MSSDQPATDVTPVVRMRWDVINKRAAEVLRISEAELTDAKLAELFGINRVSMWRLRKTADPSSPSLATALSMASILGLRVEEIAEQVNQ